MIKKASLPEVDPSEGVVSLHHSAVVTDKALSLVGSMEFGIIVLTGRAGVDSDMSHGQSSLSGAIKGSYSPC